MVRVHNDMRHDQSKEGILVVFFDFTGASDSGAALRENNKGRCSLAPYKEAAAAAAAAAGKCRTTAQEKAEKK